MIATPNELIYFLELAKTLHFTRAAEKIGISQPSLSNAIKKLEHAIGTSLFVRTRNKIILTNAGKNLSRHADQLLLLWESTKANCLTSEHDVGGSILLGCHSAIAYYFLPKLIPSIIEKHPRLEIKLQHDLSRKIAEHVISFNLDLGIVVNPVRHPALIIKKLFGDIVTFWSVYQNVKFSEAFSSVIYCDTSLLQTRYLLKTLLNINKPYPSLVTTNSLETISRLTLSGIGVGILPGRVAEHVSEGKLRRINEAPHFKDEICLIYRLENKNIKNVQAMIQAITESAKHC